VLATLPGSGNYFGAWNGDGVILMASDSVSGGPLLRIPAGGGTPSPATELDKSKKEQSHRFPSFLPDNRHFLYLSTGADARDRVVYVGSLDSKERHPLAGIAAEAKYTSGHIVFIRDGALMAQPFDLKNLKLTGDAFAVFDHFSPPSVLSWPFSVSQTGTLAYRASTEATDTATNTELVWYDRKGARLSVAVGEGDFQGPELSPDAKFVAFTRGTPADIWWLDIDKGVSTKFTTDPANDQNPRWSPDGKTIAFDSARDGVSNIYQRAVGVTGADKLLFKSDSAKTLSDWSPDGKYLAYVADNDIFALPVSRDSKTGDWSAGEAKPIQVTKSAFGKSLPRISPDSHWIAYVSNKSGRNEVYIQSFPEPGTEQQVSDGAGGGGAGRVAAYPVWSHDGKELFYYRANPNYFMSVTIKPVGASLNAAAPVQVLPHPAPRSSSTSVFNVTADGRFLLQLVPSPTNTAANAAVPNTAPASTTGITVIVNWAGNRTNAH
jgi:WD40 repeat protein